MNHPIEFAARDLADPDTFRREVAELCQPALIRDAVSDWPAVQAARRSPGYFRDYVAQFDSGSIAEVFIGEPEIAGKYYYREGLQGFNFERRRMPFAKALDAIVAPAEQQRHSMYLGSLPTDLYLPGFSRHHRLPMLEPNVAARIWLGHASNVSAHYDTLDNLACVVAGTRRFTLYAPDRVGHLYVGPIDHTMAGQPVSLAASSPRDDAKFPLFSAVREQAIIAELRTGDALYIPKLWWHQVEALGSFNALVNYWWDAFQIGPDAPSVGLLLSMITIADRPPAERAAWKAFFDHYVFRTQGHPLAHLPPSQHGVLGPMTPESYARIREHVLQLLRAT